MKSVWRIAVFSLLIAGCGGPTEPKVSTGELLQAIVEADVSQVSPSLATEVLALGGKSTEVQRDLLLKDLIGSVVEWDVQVYEVGLEEGVYRVSSQPFPVADPDAFSLLYATFMVTPRNERDHEILKAAKTDDTLKLRGRVSDVLLRNIILVSPALLVDTP